MRLERLFQNRKIRALVSESWSLSWPMTLIMFYEFLIGLSDVYVAGKLGKDIQAAYGLAFQLYFVFIIIGIALSVGSVSVISRLFTSERKDDFSSAIGSSLVVGIFSGLLFSILGIIFSGTMIGSLRVPAPLKELSIPLLRIYSIGFVLDYLLLISNGILRACGMIRRSLWTMTIVCTLNIILNFLLAFYTPLGFKGIGWATVASLFCGAALNLYYVRKVMPKRTKFSLSITKKIFKISWPSGVLQVIWQLGAIALLLILSALPQKNVEIIAAFTNALKIESAIFLPAFAFNMANAVIVGNVLGRGEREGAFRAGIMTALLGVGIVTFLTLIIMLNARRIAGFLSGNSIVVEESIRYIYIALISEPFMAWMVILGGGLNGAGDTKGVMAITAIGVWCIRIPLSYIMGIYFGYGAVAVWWSMNASIFAQCILISRRYLNRRWMAAGL